MDFLCLCEFFDERKAGSNAFHEVSRKMMEKAFPVKWPFSHEWLCFKALVQKPTNQILCNFIWSHVCFYECSSLFSFCFLQSHNVFWHSPEGVKGHKYALSSCAWLFGLLCWRNVLMAHHVVHSLLHKTLVVFHCGDESMCHTNSVCLPIVCLPSFCCFFELCDGPKQSQTREEEVLFVGKVIPQQATQSSFLWQTTLLAHLEKQVQSLLVRPWHEAPSHGMLTFPACSLCVVHFFFKVFMLWLRTKWHDTQAHCSGTIVIRGNHLDKERSEYGMSQPRRASFGNC